MVEVGGLLRDLPDYWAIALREDKVVSMGQRTHVWRSVFWSLVISAIVTEFASAVGLQVIGRPIYWNINFIKQAPLKTEKDPWGAWGVPSSQSRLVGACFDVEYKINNVGARDKERQIHSSNRWIVLGDSFVEGFGIEQSERFTNILEERLGWEFANFGSTGDFGPLQYLLVFRLLAKQFEYHGVIVGLLPFNDFTDNDSEWWKLNKNKYQQNRYRPYSILSIDNRSYKIIYGTSGDATQRTDFNIPPPIGSESQKLPIIRVLLRDLSKFSATFSLLRQLTAEKTSGGYNGGYFITDQSKITAVKLAIDDLSREIGDHPKIMLLFPTHTDLVERHRRGKNYSDQLNRFIVGLRSSGWTVIDTADAFSEADQSGDMSLGCDPHWNATTNRKVAEFLLRHSREYLTGVSTRSIQ